MAENLALSVNWNTTSSHLFPQIQVNHLQHTAGGICFPVDVVFLMIFSVDPDCFLSMGFHPTLATTWILTSGRSLRVSQCQPASNSSSSSWCSASFQVKVSEKRQHLKITWHILRSSSEKTGGEPRGTNNIKFWKLSVRLCVPFAACCHLRLSYTAQHCLYICWNLQVLRISCSMCEGTNTKRWKTKCSHTFCYSASFAQSPLFFMHCLNACHMLFCCFRWVDASSLLLFPFFRQEARIKEGGNPDTPPEDNTQFICNYCNFFLGSGANLVDLNASGLQKYSDRKMWDLPRGRTKARVWILWKSAPWFLRDWNSPTGWGDFAEV